MRGLKTVLWLEGYAVLLALLQVFNGVRTDEAKYLLDIPYPHPPLARWLLSLFDGFAWQELGARVLFATLMAQAAWIVWDMGWGLPRAGRLALCALWLASAAFVLQAGTVMMAPLTALQALLFLWILSLPKARLPGAATVAFLWLLTLFTALQGVLLVPLAVAALRRNGAPWKAVLWYAGAPLAVLALYVLTNPLVPASVLLVSGKDAALPLVDRLANAGWILVVAGSGAATVLGAAGLVLKKDPWVLAAFALAAFYLFVGGHDYYAILFLPFFVVGCARCFSAAPRLAVPATAATLLCAAALLWSAPPLAPHPAAGVMEFVAGRVQPGRVLIQGSFGHEWQYALSPRHRVGQYPSSTPYDSMAVVCADACPPPVEGDVYALHEEGPYRVWFRTGSR